MNGPANDYGVDPLLSGHPFVRARCARRSRSFGRISWYCRSSSRTAGCVAVASSQIPPSTFPEFDDLVRCEDALIGVLADAHEVDGLTGHAHQSPG